MDSVGPLVEYLGAKKFLIGNNVSMADFLLYECVDTLLAVCQDTRVFTAHPTLKAWFLRMRALPRFGEYVTSSRFCSHPFLPAAFAKLDIQPFTGAVE